jgi:hypothetical protein
MIQIPYMDLILVSGHPVPIFKTQNKKKKTFKSLSFKEEHFCYNRLFCVCFGDTEQNGQMRETKTDKQTD